MKVGALIVAAGLSSRMGAFKPLLRLEGRTIIEQEVSLFLTCGVEPVVVVTGHRAPELERALGGAFPRTAPVFTVHNPDYRGDMFRSVQAGVHTLPEEIDAFLFLPADCPRVAPATIHALLRAAKTGGALHYTPAYGGYKGHPPLLSRRLVSPLLADRGEGGLKQFLRRYPGEQVPVEDREIFRDVDTPDDYYELLRA